MDLNLAQKPDPKTLVVESQTKPLPVVRDLQARGYELLSRFQMSALDPAIS